MQVAVVQSMKACSMKTDNSRSISEIFSRRGVRRLLIYIGAKKYNYGVELELSGSRGILGTGFWEQNIQELVTDVWIY